MVTLMWCNFEIVLLFYEGAGGIFYVSHRHG